MIQMYTVSFCNEIITSKTAAVTDCLSQQRVRTYQVTQVLPVPVGTTTQWLNQSHVPRSQLDKSATLNTLSDNRREKSWEKWWIIRWNMHRRWMLHASFCYSFTHSLASILTSWERGIAYRMYIILCRTRINIPLVEKVHPRNLDFPLKDLHPVTTKHWFQLTSDNIIHSTCVYHINQ